MKSVLCTAALVWAGSVSPVFGQFAGFGPRPSIQQPPGDNTFRAGDWLVASDFDGDGDQDIAVDGVTGFSVLFNDGTGMLGNEVWYSANCFGCPSVLKSADLNGDGFDDIIISRIDARFSVWLNNGDGTFGARADFTTGLPNGNQTFMAIGDINGDSHADVVLTTTGNAVTQLFLNDGLGGFTSAGLLPISGSSPTLGFANVLIDLDLDGDLDIVVNARLNNDNTQYRLVRFINDGTGNFTQDMNFITRPSFEPTRDMLTADINADGIDDLVFSRSGGNVEVLFGNGIGGFSQGPIANAGLSIEPSQLAVADLNGDGYLDIAVGNNGTSQNTSVLINTGTGMFEPPVLYSNAFISGGGQPRSPAVVLADLDGNSTPDLISMSYSSAGVQTTFINTRLNLTDPFAPGAFDLVSVPNNSAGLPLPEVLQSWPGGGGAAPLSWTRADGFVNTYTLTIALDPGMSMVVLEQSGLTAHSFNLPTGLLQNSTRYYWQVEAENIAGTTLSSSGPWSFSTQCLGDIADDFGFTASEGGGPDGVVDFGDFVALLGLIGACP